MYRVHLIFAFCLLASAAEGNSWPTLFKTQTFPDLSAIAYDYYGSSSQASGAANAFARETLSELTIRVGLFSYSAQNIFQNVDSFSMFKPSPSTAAAVLAAPPASITRIPASDVEGEWVWLRKRGA